MQRQLDFNFVGNFLGCFSRLDQICFPEFPFDFSAGRQVVRAIQSLRLQIHFFVRFDRPQYTATEIITRLQISDIMHSCCRNVCLLRQKQQSRNDWLHFLVELNTQIKIAVTEDFFPCQTGCFGVLLIISVQKAFDFPLFSRCNRDDAA